MTPLLVKPRAEDASVETGGPLMIPGDGEEGDDGYVIYYPRMRSDGVLRLGGCNLEGSAYVVWVQRWGVNAPTLEETWAP